MRKISKNTFGLTITLVALLAVLLVACGDTTPVTGSDTVATISPTTVQTVTPTKPTTTAASIISTTQPPTTLTNIATSQPVTSVIASFPSTPQTVLFGDKDVNPAYKDRTNPSELIHAYYDAIARKDYQRAYSYWNSPDQSYSDPKYSDISSYDKFVKSFAEIDSIQYYAQFWETHPVSGVANEDYEGFDGDGHVSIIIDFIHNDGSKTNANACFYVTRKKADGLWLLHSLMDGACY